MRKIIGVFLLAMSPFVNAVTVKDVGINYVGMYGDGSVFASLDKTIPVSGCESATWIVVPTSHAHKKELYSMLLSAKVSAKKIDINSSSCLSGSVTITESSSDYILVK